MFAYLLIAFEVILLSSVYYYIFLREPRPFEIKEDIWGYYPLNDGTEHGAFQQTTLKRAKRAHPSEDRKSVV